MKKLMCSVTDTTVAVCNQEVGVCLGGVKKWGEGKAGQRKSRKEPECCCEHLGGTGSEVS